VISKVQSHSLRRESWLIGDGHQWAGRLTECSGSLNDI